MEYRRGRFTVKVENPQAPQSPTSPSQTQQPPPDSPTSPSQPESPTSPSQPQQPPPESPTSPSQPQQPPPAPITSPPPPSQPSPSPPLSPANQPSPRRRKGRKKKACSSSSPSPPVNTQPPPPPDPTPPPTLPIPSPPPPSPPSQSPPLSPANQPSPRGRKGRKKKACSSSSPSSPVNTQPPQSPDPTPPPPFPIPSPPPPPPPSPPVPLPLFAPPNPPLPRRLLSRKKVCLSSTPSPPVITQPSLPQSPIRQTPSPREQLLPEAAVAVPPSQQIRPEAALGAPSQQQTPVLIQGINRHSASQQQRPPVWAVPTAFFLAPSPSILHMCRQPMMERMNPIHTERLDQLNQLITPSPTYIFVLVARRILQELDEIFIAISGGSALRDLVNNLRKTTRNLDSAARVYTTQRQSLISRNVPGRPSNVVETTVFRYLNNLIESCQMIGNMNELILMDDPTVTAAEALRAISAISTILRDSLTELAPEVEGSQEIVERMRELSLDQRPHPSHPLSAPRVPSPTPQAPSFSRDSSPSSGSRGGSSSARGISRGGSSSSRGSSSSKAKNKGKILD